LVKVLFRIFKQNLNVYMFHILTFLFIKKQNADCKKAVRRVILIFLSVHRNYFDFIVVTAISANPVSLHH